MGFWSKDRELVGSFKDCLGLGSKVRLRRRYSWGRWWITHETTFGSVRLFRWFESIGLMPRKSLVIGALSVPEPYFPDLVRGLLDGDGSVARYTDGRGRHCFSIRFHSASEKHIRWLHAALSRRFAIRGAVNRVVRKKALGRRPMYQLTYGKKASRILAAKLYADPDAPRLVRKWLRWVAEMESGRS